MFGYPADDLTARPGRPAGPRGTSGSAGWTGNHSVTGLLEFTLSHGEVAIAGRRGADRLRDPAVRVCPDDPVVPFHEGLAHWLELHVARPEAGPPPLLPNRCLYPRSLFS